MTAARSRDQADSLVVKRAQLARVLGCSVRQIATLELDGVIRPTRRGKAGRASLYDLALTVPAVLAHERTVHSGPGLEAERAAVLREQRIRLVRENAKADGDLVSRVEVVRAGQAFARGLLAHFRSLPRRAVFAGILPESQRAALTELCDDVQAAVHEWKSVADVELAIAALETSSVADQAPTGKENRNARRRRIE